MVPFPVESMPPLPPDDTLTESAPTQCPAILRIRYLVHHYENKFVAFCKVHYV